MYLKTTYSCLFFLLCSFAVKAQKTTTEISFKLLFDNLPLELAKQYPVSEKDSLTIDFLKFYISLQKCFFKKLHIYSNPNNKSYSLLLLF